MATGPNGFKKNTEHQGWESTPSLLIEPTALLQSEILPIAIVYSPPGNGSYTEFNRKTTSAVTLSSGIEENRGQTNATAESHKVEMSPEGTPAKIGTIPLYSFSLGLSKTTEWSKADSALSTSAKAGSEKIEHITTEKWATKAYTPKGWLASVLGEKRSWFLNDRIIVFLHPQWALWDLSNGVNAASFTNDVIGSEGQDALRVGPQLLEECLGYGHEQHINVQTKEPGIEIEAEPHKVVISADECVELLKLDPFTAGWFEKNELPGNNGLTFPALESTERLLSLSKCCVNPGGVKLENNVQIPETQAYPRPEHYRGVWTARRLHLVLRIEGK